MLIIRTIPLDNGYNKIACIKCVLEPSVTFVYFIDIRVSISSAELCQELIVFSLHYVTAALCDTNM